MHSTAFQEIIDRRRSNRVFDAEIPVSDDVIQRSLERATLSPNSSNMQLWEFYWIQTPELKKEFGALCLGQPAATTAQQLVVFVTRQDLWRKRADWNAQQILSNAKGELTKGEKGGLKYYQKVMPLLYKRDPFGFMALIRRSTCFFMGLNKPFMRFGGKADQRVMVHKSCALAAQTFMLSIAAEGFETCPMEGFDAKRVKKALDLPRRAEINMIISVGKGTETGIWGPRLRVPNEEVILKK